MPSPYTIASVSNSSPARAAPALSSTPPQPTATFAATSLTSPSPKSVVQNTTPNSSSAAAAAAAGAAAASRHYYYGGPSKNASVQDTPYHTVQHIASAIADVELSQSSTNYRPRVSSLLPPPKISSHPGFGQSPPAFQDPFNAQPLDSLNDLESPPPRRPSRSSSAGGLSDSFRNLNRWSASTASSRASPVPGHRKNTSASSRRLSVDVVGSVYTSPRKLQKHRPPSQSGDAARSQSVTQLRRESVSVVPPLQSLPQIATLPSLEQELQSISPPRATSTNQRQALTGEASDDISAVYWDGPTEAPANTTLSAHIGGIEGTNTPGGALSAETMPYTQNGEPRGHSRSRSTGAKGSADTTSSKGKERDRSTKQPSQKAMLSKALQKANMAVQLDNAQNPEGAREAYAEACELLQQVMQRTGGVEDRKKLEAIRTTYTSRIEELNGLLVAGTHDEKALPRRPDSEYDRPDSMIPATSDDEDSAVETKTFIRNPREQGDFRGSPGMPSYSVPISAARRQYNPKTPQLSIETSRDDASYYLTGQYPLQSSFSRSPRLNNAPGLQPPMESQYMPPPLSPRRPHSPLKPPEREPDPPPRMDLSTHATRLAPSAGVRGHQRGNSHESVSWLDPIEESGGSAASSVHSRSSSLGIRRKHIRAPSGETEAEFDAALDDAIEAAYNDGYEPEDLVDQGLDTYQESTEEAVANALRRVEIARERVRETEREALILANEREKRLRLQQQEEEEELMREQQEHRDGDSRTEDFYDGNDSEEEERLLEEMTRGYAIEEFAFGAQTKPSVPRQSDSSGLTSRTWHSSMGSNPPTATTILTTVSESTVTSVYSKPPPSQPLPAPTQALPQLPPQPPPAGSQSPSNTSSQGVRSRRLSGQNAKQLKIETSKVSAPAPATAGPTLTQPKSGGYIVQQRQALSAGAAKTAGPFSARQASSPAPGAGPKETSAASGTSPLPSTLSQEMEGRAGSPSTTRPTLRKNFSSSSLRSMKSRNISVSNIDDASDLSPGTPLSNPYGLSGSHTRLPAMPSLPTPIAMAFKDRIHNASTGGLYLFDVDIHSPREPGSPNPLVSDAPVPLEPCPTDVMLRPFWLMRCLYQTLCHPRGGYISNKLFVPRDVWRVKGVKLKNVDDKISNCDYLTAALQKLAQVDNCDADAVLEEMQTLENVLEQVQATLTRKLGNEVGVSGANNLFKEASVADADQSSAVPRSSSVSGKSSSFWSRRLRTKTSSAGLANTHSGKGGTLPTTPVEGGAKDAVLPSLPMTSHPTSRPAKRDVSSVQFGGPNANYMSALARLFDAAQTVDQIARQVCDPGLRHADKTQVGLELCTRQAAEFFGFYVCRFVLGDLTMLLDKFIKRGSEWVLA